MVDRIEKKRLMLFGHMKRMPDSRWPLRILWNWTHTERHRRRGKPRYMYGEKVTFQIREYGTLGAGNAVDPS